MLHGLAPTSPLPLGERSARTPGEWALGRSSSTPRRGNTASAPRTIPDTAHRRGRRPHAARPTARPACRSAKASTPHPNRRSGPPRSPPRTPRRRLSRSGFPAAARLAQHIGDDLHPDATGGAAVGSHEARRGVAHIGEHIDMMAEAEGDGFQRGAPEMRRGYATGSARQRRRAPADRGSAFFRQGNTAGRSIRPSPARRGRPRHRGRRADGWCRRRRAGWS